MRAIRVGLRYAWILGLVVLGCLGGGVEGLPSDRSVPLDDGGVPFGDGAGREPCPETEPKVGEACPRGLLDTDGCEYQVGQCVGPSELIYTEHVTFCCLSNVWRICASRSPCEGYEAGMPPSPPAVVDGPAAVDAPPAPDAAVDAPAGGGVDAAVDAAVDAPADAAAAVDGSSDAPPAQDAGLDAVPDAAPDTAPDSASDSAPDDAAGDV